MRKKVTYSVIYLLIFSLFFISANALPGTCKNPNGGTYCGNHNDASNCWCDGACLNYGDCCDDYKEVCNVQAASCKDSDGGANYYVKGTATSSDGSSLNDSCVKKTASDGLFETGKLLEAICDGASKKYVTFKCPESCNDGACHSEPIPDFVKEKITCIFKNSDVVQKCSVNLKYGGDYHPFSCSGVDQCSFLIEGPKGIEQSMEESSCSGDELITLDGKDEVHYFICAGNTITKKDVIKWIDDNC